MLQYKPDWEQARQRLEAWWEGETVDRAVIQVHALREAVVPELTWDVWQPSFFLNDPEQVVDAYDAFCRGIFFGGEAFPNLWINLGPGIMATYIGAEPRFRDNTTWFETPKDWAELDAIEFDPNNGWWQRTRALTAVAVEKGRGRFLTGMTDIGGTLDVVASMRGTQRLLVDLVDSPDRVKAFTARLNALWFRCYAELYAIMQPGMMGTSAWMGIWSPARWYPLQCDFSAMISPRMFAEFVLPHLTEQCRWLDHPLYHWDGPGQIPHLDLLLEIKELRGIQWVPGAGAEPPGSPKWYPLYKRILASGKNLVVEVFPEDVEPLICELGPKRILMQTVCATESEARHLLDRVARLGGG